MLAEIHGKISSSGSNLSDRLEDKLTGDVFGHLRYLPPANGLIPILKTCRFKENHIERFHNLLNKQTKFEYRFWPSYIEGEPDLIIESENLVILIEVKYLSGLSSDDEENDPELSRHQLSREARILNEIRKNKKGYLIFLAKEEEAASIYNQTIKKENISNTIAFGYLSWSDVFEALQSSMNSLSEESINYLILSDILALLKRKGFERFKNFTIEGKDVLPDLFFHFKSKRIEFSFDTPTEINTKHYEYR